MNCPELTSQKYLQITPLLGKYAEYPVVNAVLEGNSPGRIFVDNPTHPKSTFVLTNAGFAYLVGSPRNHDFNNALKKLLNDKLFPEIKESNDPTLIFYPLADGWEVSLKEILGERKIHDLFRKQFTFNPEKFAQHSDWQNQIPAGFQIEPVSQTLLDKFRIDMFPWESPQAFIERGFGFWLTRGDEIACECSSVFVGGNAVEINIHTSENYRKQGFAQLTASVFVEECLSRGLRPNWECWWDNEPSVALAQKLGFEPVKDHPVFLVEIKNR